MEYHTTYVESPIGTLAITGSEAGVRAVMFLNSPPTKPDAGEDAPAPLRECRAQLEAYFKGELTEFTAKLDLQGTDFQLSVWQRLLEIPFGTMTTYGKLAQELGVPDGAQAVGSANGSNPIAVVVPCHRVIGTNGDLTGYAGGLHRKRWLLAHEGNPMQQSLF